VLANPLVYLSEAMRATLTPTIKHMTVGVYLPLTVLLLRRAPN